LIESFGRYLRKRFEERVNPGLGGCSRRKATRGLEEALPPLDDARSVEVNFEPVTPRRSVSGLVKVGRRHREKCLSYLGVQGARGTPPPLHSTP